MYKRYCAFLRGINVNGTNMKMADVVSVFEKAGMNDVIAVLATGNIIFSSDKNSDNLRILLEKAMSEHFSYEAFLFVKSKTDVEKMIESNPFTDNDDFHIYFFVCETDFEKTLLDEYNKAKKIDGEQAESHNDFFYWRVKKGATLDGEFSKTLSKKQFKDKLTSRNKNTMEKILKKMM